MASRRRGKGRRKVGRKSAACAAASATARSNIALIPACRSFGRARLHSSPLASILSPPPNSPGPSVGSGLTTGT